METTTPPQPHACDFRAECADGLTKLTDAEGVTFFFGAEVPLGEIRDTLSRILGETAEIRITLSPIFGTNP